MKWSSICEKFQTKILFHSGFTSFILITNFFLFSSIFCQNKINDTTPEDFFVFSYGPDTIHARGIQIYNKSIYTANSNGHVYSFDLKTKKGKLESKKAYPELRDLFILNRKSLYAMQSADSCSFIHYEQHSSKGENKNQQKETAFSTFLDAFDIRSTGYGILIGDPVEDVFQVFTTSDFGNSWNKKTHQNLQADKGEAAFAASGTTAQVLNDSTYFFVSGGKIAHVYQSSDYGRTWSKSPIPFRSSESSGPFSMCFWTKNSGIVVGGDYMKPNDTINNCFLTNDGGKTWQQPNKTTSGYKSCVVKAGNTLYACGTNGIDCSFDFGKNWKKINNTNTFSMTYDKKYVYATSKNGNIIRIRRR